MPDRYRSDLQFVFLANASAFQVSSAVTGRSGAAMSMFCSEDGVISGWNLDVALPKEEDVQFTPEALILVDNSKAGAVYKGCELGGTASAPLIFAANLAAGAVDVIDGNLTI
jgi:hypothetical protein